MAVCASRSRSGMILLCAANLRRRAMSSADLPYIVDAHHHLWDLQACRHTWLAERGVVRFFGDPAPLQKNYHVIDFNPETGEVRKKNTHQGFAHESAWSRGQAWGLYGFTATYRYTKDPVFLKKAEEIASFIFKHPNLPEDLIPYWDYDAPNIPNEPRDVSAATVAASGLIELSEYVPEKAATYLAWADQILLSLEKET